MCISFCEISSTSSRNFSQDLYAFLPDLINIFCNSTQHHEYVCIFARSQNTFSKIFSRSRICVYFCQISSISSRNASQDHEFLGIFSKSQEYLLGFFSPDHESVYFFAKSNQCLLRIFSGSRI